MLFGSFLTLHAQEAVDTVSGRYEGVFKGESMGDMSVIVELKNAGGKLSGKIESGGKDLPITDGSFADGKVKLKFKAHEGPGEIAATLSDDEITGEWNIGDASGTVELRKLKTVPPVATATGR